MHVVTLSVAKSQMEGKLATDLSESTWNAISKILISFEMLPRLMSLNVGLEVMTKCLSNVLTVCNFTELHVWFVGLCLINTVIRGTYSSAYGAR